MKKFIGLLLVMALMGTGLWWMTRRKPGAPPPEEAPIGFKAERAGKGIEIQYEDFKLPIRSLRWLRPLPGGFQIAQVITQSDRQQIACFANGVFQDAWTVPRPQGVRDGFFNFAILQDACLWPGDVAVLLYRSSESENEELPLVLALDLKTKEIRWIHRGKGTRLVPTSSAPDAFVYLFGTKESIVRLPVAAQPTEQPHPSGFRSVAKDIELPAEIQEVGDLLPMGPWTFLVAYKGGLSAYLGVKGWRPFVLPELPPVAFQDSPPKLVRAKDLWWQPQPGTLVQLHSDGTPKQTWTQKQLVTSEPFSKDGYLLHLLGSDPSGKLWFDLSAPGSAASFAPAEVSDGAESTDVQEASPHVDLFSELSTYASKGTDRIYRWSPEDRILKRFAWKELAKTAPPPAGIGYPSEIPRLYPESGGLLLSRGNAAWWLSQDAFPFGDPSITENPGD
jgi:hypothetical protein